jgi:hypothetical protein
MAERTLSDILEESFAHCHGLEVPLSAWSQAFSTEVRRMGPHFTVAVDNLVRRLTETGAGATAPQGRPADAALLVTRAGSPGWPRDLLEGVPLAIPFHHRYWCLYRRININALGRRGRDRAGASSTVYNAHAPSKYSWVRCVAMPFGIFCRSLHKTRSTSSHSIFTESSRPLAS